MQVRWERLAATLERGLAPAYFVSGDETLIVEECCDAIIASARQRGFGERTILDPESGFEWPALAEAAGSLSLFTERRILDLRAPPRFFGDCDAALGAYLEAGAGDTVLLMRTGRLDGRQRSAKWFKRLESDGVVIVVWPLDRARLVGWLAERARRAGLVLEREALEFLAESVEGNLLAAAQEIEKLCLLDLPQPIAVEALRAVVLDASHFDGFDLLDAALAGEAGRARRILGVLAEEGAQSLALLGQLLWWIRRLALGGLDRMPQQRAKLMESARARLGASDFEAVLGLAERIDRQVKGAAPGDPWRTLETLVLRIAGVTLRVE